jgi:hypothetical protein
MYDKKDGAYVFLVELKGGDGDVIRDVLWEPETDAITLLSNGRTNARRLRTRKERAYADVRWELVVNAERFLTMSVMSVMGPDARRHCGNILDGCVW